MEITAIETKTFEQMQKRFADFFHSIKDLCGNDRDRETWLTNTDICALLKISKRTLQSYRDVGILPFSQIGHKCYYKTSDIEQFINQHIKEKSNEK
ncbi:DNA-binding protein [Bacteroidia bacterium]|nr:DNA-binding protein [Bacteroidia bacterium]